MKKSDSAQENAYGTKKIGGLRVLSITETENLTMVSGLSVLLLKESKY